MGRRLPVPQFFVKSPVFPFNKFPGVDPALGPEMRSTGEVMGVGANFGEAFAKAQLSAGTPLPEKGCVFVSVNNHDKPAAVDVARRLVEFGFSLVATRGTAAVLQAAGLRAKTIFKVNEGRPNAVDLMKAGSIQLVIYTPAGAHSFSDEKAIRRTAIAAPDSLHHDHERGQGRRRSRSLPPARPDPGLEPARDPRPGCCASNPLIPDSLWEIGFVSQKCFSRTWGACAGRAGGGHSGSRGCNPLIAGGLGEIGAVWQKHFSRAGGVGLLG